MDIVFGDNYILSQILQAVPTYNRCLISSVSKKWLDFILAYSYNRPYTEAEFYAACREGDIIYLNNNVWPIQWLVYGFCEACKGGQDQVIRRFLRLLTNPREDGVPKNRACQLIEWRKYALLYKAFNVVDILDKYLPEQHLFDMASIMITDNIDQFTEYYKFHNSNNDIEEYVKKGIEYNSENILAYMINNKITSVVEVIKSNQEITDEKIELVRRMSNNRLIGKVPMIYDLFSIEYESLSEILEITKMAIEHFHLLKRKAFVKLRLKYKEVDELLEPHISLQPQQCIEYMAAGGINYIDKMFNTYGESLYNDEFIIEKGIANAMIYCYDVETALYAIDLYNEKFRLIGVAKHIAYHLSGIEDIIKNNHIPYTGLIAILKKIINICFTNDQEKSDRLQSMIAVHLLMSLLNISYKPRRGTKNEYNDLVDYMIATIISYKTDWYNNLINLAQYEDIDIIMKIVSKIPEKHFHYAILFLLLKRACQYHHYQLLRIIMKEMPKVLDEKCKNCGLMCSKHMHMVRL